MIDLVSLSQKLTECRNRLQYTLEEVNELTGIEAKRLQLIETGKSEPTGDEILILADLFKEDYKYFISNKQKSGSENTEILYRKFKSEFTKFDRRSIQEFLYLCECEQDIWDLLEEQHRQFNPVIRGDFYKKHGEQVAASLRNFLGYDESSILSNIYDDFRSIGIHIFRRKLVNSSISGLFLVHPRAGKCVLVNYEEDLFRQNFTVAHEVGHALFDSDQTFNVSFIHEKGDKREFRANAFAANYLIPSEKLEQFDRSIWTPDNIQRVAARLRVNVITLLIRLKSLGIIDQSDYYTLKAMRIEIVEKKDPELDNLTPKIREAKLAIFERGLSSNYIRKCHEAYSRGLISRNRLAEILLTDEAELPVLLDLFKLKVLYEH